MAYEKKALEKTILDITERQLFGYGYKSLNLNEVAKEAGISKVALYKIFDSKYEVTSRVIKRILVNSDLEMSNLLQSELPLQRKIEQGIKIISSVYLKMDKDFLYDLEHSLPELWQQIDDVRKSKEEMIARLLTDAQNGGTIREDMDAKLLSALIMALIRGVYNPNFFFNHNVSADTVGSIIVNIFMDGILKDE